MGSLFGGRTSRERNQDAQFNAAFQPLINQQTQASQWSLGEGKNTLGKANQTLQGPTDFWNKLLSGDRNEAFKLFAPGIDSMRERSNAQQGAISEFAPRGGRRTDQLGDMQRDDLKQINQFLLGARPEAANQLQSIAQLLFGVGQGEVNASTGASGNALQALLGNRGLNLQERGLRNQGLNNLTGVGQFLGGLF